MRLATKLMLVFFSAVLAITIAFSFIDYRQTRHRYVQRHAREAREMVQTHEDSLASAWGRAGRAGLESKLDDVRSELHRAKIEWFLATRDVAQAADLPSHLIAALERRELVSYYATDRHGSIVLHVFCPLRLGSHGAFLQIAQPAGDMQRELRMRLTNLLWLLAAIFGVSVVVVMVAGVRMVGRPLQSLIEKTQHISKGKLDTPLQIKGHDELAMLAASINEMSQRIAEQQDRIRAETASRISTLEQLRHVDRLKTVGRLAAGIAHELGTPLNVISGRAGMIASGRLNEDKQCESARIIKDEADRIGAIIRQLLDFARQNTPRRRPVAIGPVVVQTIDLLKTLAAKRDIQLLTRLDDEAARSTAEIDVSQIQQVLTNIVVNAMQASPEESTVEIGLHTATTTDNAANAPADYLCITIQDRGHGMDDVTKDQIFEPFFTTKPDGVGTGLGLSIAYGIMEEHDGWIDVSSEPGQGTMFTIYLPRSVKGSQQSDAR